MTRLQKQEEITLDFPRQLVIFLEENQSIKDQVSFNMRLPDGQYIKYKVPVMKYWQYSVQALKDKKMYALLPLQVFKARKRIMTIYHSNKAHTEKAQLINKEFEVLLATIKTTIDVLKKLKEQDEIYVSDLEKILKVMTNITEYLYNKYGHYTDVGNQVYTMVTTLYNPVIEERGKKKGKIEGKIEDILDILKVSVK